MAENNHQRTLALRAPRGVIYDRTGEVLVENRSSFNISIVREHTKDLDRTVRLLAQRHRHRRSRGPRHRRTAQAAMPSYRPIVVVHDATLAQVAAVTARRLDFELPDVVVQEVPTRRYPSQALAAHLIGYVGEASDQQVTDDGLSSGAIVGTVGRRARLQPTADGRGRRPSRRGEQRRPRDPRARRSRRPPRGTASSSRSTTRCSGRRRTPSAPTATGARRSCSIRAPATC